MEALRKQPQVWEILVALLPIFAGIAIWLMNLGNKVERHDIRIDNIEKSQSEYRMDINHINEKLELILIRLENKADRKIQ